MIGFLESTKSNRSKETYIFFYESKSSDYSFEIKAETPDEAFDLAYDAYGPQVQDMICQLKF